MISALACPTVFACHCHPEAGELRIGILALHEEFEPGIHRLYSLDERQWFNVEIYGLTTTPSYNIVLKYGDSFQDFS